MMSEQVEQLPRFDASELSFLDIDEESIKQKLVRNVEESLGRKLQKSDPIYLLLCAIANVELILRLDIDNACKNNILTYAQGKYLDNIGELVSCKRNQSSKAHTKLKFTLNQPSPDLFIIPKSTKVSDGRVIFATDAIAQIPKGKTSVEVNASAITPGSFANGIAIGQINTMVDQIPYLSEVTNIEESTGGGDIEDDEAYAQRVRLAPDAFSVAGPMGAYVFHCRSFSSELIDVMVYGLNEKPGYVFIHPLLKGGKIPEPSFLESLSTYLSADTIRPLTDYIEVSAPKAIEYTIKFKWYLNIKDIDNQQAITLKVKEAAENYRLWQQSQIGRNINPDELTKMVKEAGAERLEIESPVFRKVNKDEVAQCLNQSVQIEFAGIEE